MAIPGAQIVNYNSDFYHASVETVLTVCGKQIEPDGKLMLLGHNPGWAALHEYFTGHYHNYPTGACTVMSRNYDSDGDWLDPAGCADRDVASVSRPRLLPPHDRSLYLALFQRRTLDMGCIDYSRYPHF